MTTIRQLALCLIVTLGAIEASAEPSVTADVVYGHKLGLAMTYDVIRPDVPNGAAILYMVSGGWISRFSPPEGMIESFKDELDAGFTIIPVRHGSSPLFKVPDAYSDVQRAVRHARLEAASYGIDPEDGGNVRFPALNFAVDQAASVSPITFVSADDPPTLLIHGDADTLVDISASQNIAAEFEDAGVTYDFITIEGAGHGFRGEDAARADAARLAWFEAKLLD